MDVDIDRRERRYRNGYAHGRYTGMDTDIDMDINVGLYVDVCYVHICECAFMFFY